MIFFKYVNCDILINISLPYGVLKCMTIYFYLKEIKITNQCQKSTFLWISHFTEYFDTVC